MNFQSCYHMFYSATRQIYCSWLTCTFPAWDIPHGHIQDIQLQRKIESWSKGYWLANNDIWECPVDQSNHQGAEQGYIFTYLYPVFKFFVRRHPFSYLKLFLWRQKVMNQNYWTRHRVGSALQQICNFDAICMGYQKWGLSLFRLYLSKLILNLVHALIFFCHSHNFLPF